VRQILTDAACKTKPPRNGRLEIADLRQAGLVLRITANGARSFAFRFRHPHTRKTLRATIGSYPQVSLEVARKRAREMAAEVGAGKNPIDSKRAEREAAPTRTFQALADRYLKEHAERHKRPRSAEEDRRNLAVHVLPRWAKRDFRTIRRADVIELIEAIVSANCPRTQFRKQKGRPSSNAEQVQASATKREQTRTQRLEALCSTAERRGAPLQKF
jgi:hypothetical protein